MSEISNLKMLRKSHEMVHFRIVLFDREIEDNFD